MSAELALEYEQKMDDAKDVYVQQDDVLAMQLSQLHRSKCQMQSELQAVTRERDHLSQCMQLLHSNDPALFQVGALVKVEKKKRNAIQAVAVILLSPFFFALVEVEFYNIKDHISLK
jgi:hypothetical protein